VRVDQLDLCLISQKLPTSLALHHRQCQMKRRRFPSLYLAAVPWNYTKQKVSMEIALS